MADVDFPTRDGYRTQLREVAPGVYVPVFALADATSSGGGGSVSKPVANITYSRFTGATGALSFTIPAGALEISVVNSGTLDVGFKSASMASPTVLTPETLPGATAVNVRAPQGYELEECTVTVAAAGQTVEYLVIREA